jgi:hypothetical protein
MLVNHYFIEWDAFPAWYNIVVPFVISLSILAGGGIRSATA